MLNSRYIINSKHSPFEIVSAPNRLLSQPCLCLPFNPSLTVQVTLLLLYLTQEVLIERVSSNLSILYNLVEHIVVV
jgi:hypothetical protein